MILHVSISTLSDHFASSFFMDSARPSFWVARNGAVLCFFLSWPVDAKVFGETAARLVRFSASGVLPAARHT